MQSAVSSTVRVGGGELLRVFFAAAKRIVATRLYVVAPYVDDGALEDDELRRAWRHLLAASDVSVVVRTPGAAQAVLRSASGVQRARLDLRLDPRVHTKLYVGMSGSNSIALVGSANLTGAALHTNLELGFLLIPGEDEAARALVRQFVDAARDTVRAATPLVRPRL